MKMHQGQCTCYTRPQPYLFPLYMHYRRLCGGWAWRFAVEWTVIAPPWLLKREGEGGMAGRYRSRRHLAPNPPRPVMWDASNPPQGRIIPICNINRSTRAARFDQLRQRRRE